MKVTFGPRLEPQKALLGLAFAVVSSKPPSSGISSGDTTSEAMR